DGSLIDNAANGGPELFFRNNARFSHPGCIPDQPVTPLNRDVTGAMSDGYYIPAQQNSRIPAIGTGGSTALTIPVFMNKTISNIDVFVALNHSDLSSLSIYLRAPNGDSVRLISNYSNLTVDNNLMTVFDDQADSSLTSNKYNSLYTKVRPENNLNSAFGGGNSQGDWTIRVIDGSPADTGIIYTCGIRFNNTNIREKNLNASLFIQGFYNTAGSFLISDTVSVILRHYTTFAKLDSAKSMVAANGDIHLSFANISNGEPVYVVLNHRNSLETWSAFYNAFTYSGLVTTFGGSASLAFGNNQIQVDDVPLRFGIFSGDINKDGLVNLNDIILVTNDASNFTTGYINSDLNGDNIANLNDILIAFNNSNNFVHLIRP
ncbi:MAG: proprotein convertase P-domain-containing protein, partial [Ignavibacteria bacterium]